MAAELPARTTGAADIEFQPASLDIWDAKYRLAAKDGTKLDESIDETYRRVAKALASVEVESKQEHYFEEFLWALRSGAIPAGRIVSNAGARQHKPATSTINCTVSDTIHDSMNEILGKVHEAGLTLKAGCGIGYEFSTLRPNDAYVSGSGALTSGPLSFMDIYDKVCFTVSSAGGRRGAQMATFDVGHPDVLDFIRAKREDGRLRQFNCSLLITDEFMQAVNENADWALAFPITPDEASELDIDDPDKVLWREWSLVNDYVTREDGLVACKVYKKVPARRMWDMIMSSTYDFAEPGFILIDRINEMNNNWFCENIRATNPCGEQPLPPYGACLLGSVNLTRFVENPFTPQARFNWEEYGEVVKVFTRMLDNVVEINGLPLGKQRDEIMRKRRHGMGFLGLGSTLTMMGMKYGSPESLEFTEKVSREMALAGWEEGLALAREKGPAPIMNEDFEVTAEMLAKRPQMVADGYKLGDKVKGKVLHSRYSTYMQRVAAEEPELVRAMTDAGFAVGTTAPLDLDAMLRKHIYILGTSGSMISDMKAVLGRLEAGTLDTNISVYAVSGMQGVDDALGAVMARTSGGKIVIAKVQPQIQKVFDVVKAMPDASIFESLDEGVGVHRPPSTNVDEERGLLHDGEQPGVEHILGVRCHRQAVDHHIGFQCLPRQGLRACGRHHAGMG